jgi:putative ABC transport system permease protein
MYRHYLTFAIRALAQNRAYAVINIGGLALGLAGCLMILGYVRYERGYDRWLPDHARMFQVQTTSHATGQPVVRSQASPAPVRDLLPAAFPQIEAISVMQTGPAPMIRGGEPVFVDSATVDPAFFTILRLPFVRGSAATALSDTKTIVLTESEARKQFGTIDILGRTLSIGAGPGRTDFRVGGVLRDLPPDTSLKLGVIFRNFTTAADDAAAATAGWGAMSQTHYVRLRSPADAAAINAALPAWQKRVVPGDADNFDLKLVPVADVHLGEAQQAAVTPGGDPRTLATFMIVAALTLGMAVMNFANLATTRATQRGREVALRRVLGATPSQLAQQMLVESLLISGLAMLLALTLVELATPAVARMTGARLTADYLGPRGMLLPALVLWLATALAGGLYPMLHLARLRPGAVLRANHATVDAPGGRRVRGVLVVGQFAVAIGLIASTWVIEAQTHFLRNLDPGYARDGMIQIDAAWRFAGDDSEYRAASAALRAIPGIVSAGRTDLALAATNRSEVAVRTSGATRDLSIGSYAVDPGFFATMRMPLLAGRLPDDAHAEDRIAGDAEGETAARSLNIVVNRAAARALGFADPTRATGTTLRMTLDGAMVPATIVGIVADTRIRTPRDPLEPIVYRYDPGRTSQVLIRYVSADPAQVMAAIHRVWRRFEPEIPFQARFAEDILAETWAAERTRGTLFAGFSALAIVIACLGLYALSAFTIQRRTREIGIRKVLGAKVRHIVRLLAWQFSRPVMLANLIAWPLAWWAMRDWLDTFDVRIALTPAPFLIAGLAALALAVATVAGHAVRVARMSPIHALRHD